MTDIPSSVAGRPLLRARVTPASPSIWLFTLTLSLALTLGCGNDGAAPPASTAADATQGDAQDGGLGSSDAGHSGAQRTAADFRKDGAYAVGARTYTLHDIARSRTLNVEVVYPIDPAEAAAVGALDMAAFCTSTADRAAYKALLAEADPTCATRSAAIARDGKPAAGTFPVVLFSHCHNCTRFSSLALLRRLASHGVIAVAPDHADNTLFDFLAWGGVSLGKPFLATRVADLKAVLDDAAAGDKSALPPPVRGHLNLAQVGALGHSFGSVTVGLFSQQDSRVKAVAGIAAPMQNPLLPGVKMSELHKPVLLLLAREDNSITALGNTFLRNNYKDAPGPAWKVEVDDAGHWSFSDIAGLHSIFDPGCGEAKRMTDGSVFTYLPVADAQRIAANWVGAFFAAQLQKDPGAISFLAEKPSDTRAHVERKPTP